MTAAVVDGLDLEIGRPQPAVAVLVLDARVGKLDVPILVRQFVLDGPAMDLVRRSIGPAVAGGSTAIALLQELLVIALELVVEDDAVDQRALFAEPLSLLQVRAIDLRVAGQFAGLAKARVKQLPDLADVRPVAILARPPIVRVVPKGSASDCNS
jgi:hypothetical protein